MITLHRRDVLKLTGATLVTAGVMPSRVSAQPENEFGSWPQAGYDAANTGYNPDAVGPRDDIAQAWEFGTDADASGHWAPHTEPMVFSDFVILPALDGYYYALEAATGAEIARVETEAGAVSRPAIGDRAVFAETDVDVIRAFEIEGDAERWSYRHPLGDGPYRLTYADGRLYLPGVIALNTDDGSEAWVADTGAGWFGVAVADETVFAAVEAGSEVYALDAGDGSERWVTEIDGRIEELVAPVVGSGRVVVQSESSHLHALDTVTGELAWTFDPRPSTRNASTPAIHDGTLYYGHSAPADPDTISEDAGTLFAIDLGTGEERWSIPTRGGIGASPVVADGVVYVGTFGDEESRNPSPRLIAVAADSGEVLWQSEMAFDVVALSIAGERLYAMVSDGVLEVFGPAASTTPVAERSDDTAESGARNVRSPMATVDTGLASSRSGDSDRGQRGFFSNDGSDPAFLTNMFNLTVLGFLLSLLGLVYQMLGGD